MRRETVGVRGVRRLAIITTAGIALLVVAGGVVRLTGSGLGCDDWPNCNSERFVDVSSGHTAIEQINRILSALIGLPTLALAFCAFRVPVRTVRAPAIGVLVSVLANGVVGGLAVRGDLHPALVQSHFLLAMVSLAFGMAVVHRTRPVDANGGRAADVAAPTRGLVRLLAVGTASALVTGTVVTGTGPHAGDEDARRFGFDIVDVARIHSVVVLATLAVGVALAWQLRRDDAGRHVLGSTLSAWIFVGLVQGGVGYVQYFNGVPELLVGAHLALATALWLITLSLWGRVAPVASRPRGVQSAARVTSAA